MNFETFKISIHDYTPPGGDLVMVWVNDRDYACLECVPRDFAQYLCDAHNALVEIAGGEGAYGAQAFSFKRIARAALGAGQFPADPKKEAQDNGEPASVDA